MRRHTRIIAAAAAVATTAALATTPASAAPKESRAENISVKDSRELREALTVRGIKDHQRALQRIANRNDDNRASGTSGYRASVRYVARQLRKAGYKPVVQPFPFLFFQENSPAEFQQVSPTPTTYVVDSDFITMDFSGSGDVTGELVPALNNVEPPGPTPSSSSAGCLASDYAPAPAGSAVALVQRGTCTFGQKAMTAEAAGYDAVIIYNEGQPGRTDTLQGTLGAPVGIPVIGISYALGSELLNQDRATPVTVRVRTDTISEERTTTNVIGDTTTGRADRTVVVGAHLDSVNAGPGINDNGSGSGTILEIAEQMSRLGIEPTNRVRFAFWGAEEAGLLGSEYYVANLSEAELDDIMLNLNFDMVSSPNYVRFVYDGDNSAFPVGPGAAPGPPGSAEIEDVFTDYFDAKGLASAPTAFSGRSDYGPFIAAGVDIPAGGLFTGAEGIKTEEEAAIFGGLAGVAYDPCYHQACDVYSDVKQKMSEGFDAELYAMLEDAYTDDRLVGNVNVRALNEMSDAAAHATYYFATTTMDVSEGSAARGFLKAKGKAKAKAYKAKAALYKGGLQR